MIRIDGVPKRLYRGSVDFRTISGERIEGKGLAPDIEVQRGGAADTGLEEALRYLKDAALRRR